MSDRRRGGATAVGTNWALVPNVPVRPQSILEASDKPTDIMHVHHRGILATIGDCNGGSSSALPIIPTDVDLNPNDTYTSSATTTASDSKN